MKIAILVSLSLVVVGTTDVAARARPSAYGAGVPDLDVKGSCLDAQKFSSGEERGNAYKGCMQDETTAKEQLSKRWSGFRPKDRQNCVEQARAPSPSYVEVLTCLEMYGDAMASTPRVDGKSVPQIGGPVAPGLSQTPAPATPALPAK